jgi:hypothetical protein
MWPYNLADPEKSEEGTPVNGSPRGPFSYEANQHKVDRKERQKCMPPHIRGSERRERKEDQRL